MCLEEIGICIQNMIISIVGSICEIIVGGGEGEDLYDLLINMRIFMLIISQIFVRVSKFVRKVAPGSIWICKPSCSSRVFDFLEVS